MPGGENIVLAVLAHIYIELRHTQRVGYVVVRQGRRVLILFEQNYVPQ